MSMKSFTVINSSQIFIEGRGHMLTETWRMPFMEFLEKYRDCDIYVHSFSPESVSAIVIKDVNNLLLLSSN